MITKRTGKDAQVEMVSIEQLVPADHLLRKIDEYIDFTYAFGINNFFMIPTIFSPLPL